jgi:hypothetical protein
MFKAHNPLSAAVDAESGLRVDRVLKTAEENLQRMQDPMRDSLKAWIGEIATLSATAEPDRDRLAWLANGVLGIAGACHQESLARCGGMFGRAIEAMSETGWRVDAARLYAASMVKLLGGVEKAEQAAVLASLETMTQRLADGSAAG